MLHRFMRTLIVIVFSPIVILFATPVRLLVISDYDPTTATTIVASGGVTQTVVGTLTTLLPTYFPVIAVLLIVGVCFDLIQLRLFVSKWIMLGLVVCGVLLVTPVHGRLSDVSRALAGERTAAWRFSHLGAVGAWFWPAVVVGAVVVIGSAIWVNARFKLGFGVGDFFAAAGILLLAFCRLVMVPLVAAFLFVISITFVGVMYPMPYHPADLSLALRRPWLPSEKIVLRSGSVKVGYTLAVKDGWQVILGERTRTIEYVKSDDVVTRQVCRLGPATSERPFIDLLRTPAGTVPACP